MAQVRRESAWAVFVDPMRERARPPRPEEVTQLGGACRAPRNPFVLQRTLYELIATWRGNATLSVPPFEALELELGALWAR